MCICLVHHETVPVADATQKVGVSKRTVCQASPESVGADVKFLCVALVKFELIFALAFGYDTFTGLVFLSTRDISRIVFLLLQL